MEGVQLSAACPAWAQTVPTRTQSSLALANREQDVLRFLHNSAIPFTNN